MSFTQFRIVFSFSPRFFASMIISRFSSDMGRIPKIATTTNITFASILTQVAIVIATTSSSLPQT